MQELVSYLSCFLTTENKLSILAKRRKNDANVNIGKTALLIFLYIFHLSSEKTFCELILQTRTLLSVANTFCSSFLWLCFHSCPFVGWFVRKQDYAQTSWTDDFLSAVLHGSWGKTNRAYFGGWYLWVCVIWCSLNSQFVPLEFILSQHRAPTMLPEILTAERTLFKHVRSNPQCPAVWGIINSI